jgi:hypothetical protein
MKKKYRILSCVCVSKHKAKSQRLPGLAEQFLASKNAGETVVVDVDDDDDEH